LGAGIGTHTVDIKGLKAALQGDDSAATLQELHDMLIEMGAKCAHGDSKADGGGEPSGQASDSEPSGLTPGTYAALVSMELMEAGPVDGHEE
jgi:hypothetical protein